MELVSYLVISFDTSVNCEVMVARRKDIKSGLVEGQEFLPKSGSGIGIFFST
jgi:hypothetical protein